ncbi:response regulator [bacterium]|nr:response regulator [bacterium]
MNSAMYEARLDCKVLFVDDDRNLLQGYKRQLHKLFPIETASGGNSALIMLEQNGPFAVIVSDMRMPEMDGAAFLTQARVTSPDSVRMMLTGQADMNDAIAAVNEGQLFRFLTKPCSPEVLAKAINDGIDQYKLVIAEKELLNKTLKGTIKLLVDIVSLLSPHTFSRSLRLRSLAVKIANRLHVKDPWQVDVAALLCQIGTVTVPADILEKRVSGQSLTQAEQDIYLKHLQIGKDLLANIPRLETIALAILYQEKRFDGIGPPVDQIQGRNIPLLARILKVVLDYDDSLIIGKSHEDALQILRDQECRYDPDVLAALRAEVMDADEGFVIKDIEAKDIKIGMIVAEDIRTKTNLLLVPKRHEVSQTIRICVLNFAEKGNVREPVRIIESIDS